MTAPSDGADLGAQGLEVGVSATGYRCEGGFNGPGEPANQWAPWERVGPSAEPAGGVDLWRSPEPAIAHAAAAGAQVLALSVEWARVEPAPGKVDDAALARYAEILELAGRRGLAPVVILQDIAHPQWLGEEFWLTPGAPDRFAEHAARVADRLAPHCRHWVTVRQPNHLAYCAWVAGAHPPRRLGALSDAWAALDNLLCAHVLCFDEIHRIQRDATVALGVRRAPSYDAHRLGVDLVCARRLGIEREEIDAWVDERRAVHDLAVPSEHLAELAARRVAGLVSPFGSRARGIRRPNPRRVLDVVYGRAPAAPPPIDALWLVWRPSSASPAGSGRSADAARDAGALATWCESQQVLVPDLPIWIEDGVALGPHVPGEERAAYLRASLRSVSHARAAGARIAAYVYHCLGPDTDMTLSRSGWISRLVPAAAQSHVAGDYGLFDVVVPQDGEPEWRDRDAGDEGAGAAFGRLTRATRDEERRDGDPPKSGAPRRARSASGTASRIRVASSGRGDASTRPLRARRAPRGARDDETRAPEGDGEKKTGN